MEKVTVFDERIVFEFEAWGRRLRLKGKTIAKRKCQPV